MLTPTAVLPPVGFGPGRARLLSSATSSVPPRVDILVSGFFEPPFYLLSWSRAESSRRSSRIGGISSPTPLRRARLARVFGMNADLRRILRIFFKLKIAKTYDAGGSDATRGGTCDRGAGWSLIRGTVYSIAFPHSDAGFGLIRRWWQWPLPAAPCW